MRVLRTLLLLLSAVALATALAAAQDEDSQPSLGNVARQARLQKQKEAQAAAKDKQNKDAQDSGAQSQAVEGGSAQGGESNNAPTAGAATPAKGAAKDASAKNTLARAPKKVVTNDEIPEHIGPTSTLPVALKTPGQPDPPNNTNYQGPPQYLKNQILQLKQAISNLEGNIQDVTDSIRYAGGSCVSNCAQVNLQQQQKQQQVEAMTSQLTQMQKALENVQEMARKQGFSSAVYDPEP